MSPVYFDIETFSAINLKTSGAHIYAAHASTGVHFLCYAIDGGEVQTWRPGDPVPEPFANPGGHTFVSHNWQFERAILRHVLIPRYGFTPIALEQQDCAQRLALANCYPAELGLVCEALGLPYKKDPEAYKTMLRLAKPAVKKPKDPDQRRRDLVLLEERCKSDVEATRAVYRSPRLQDLLVQEYDQLLLDAVINEHGIAANVPFLEALRDLSVKERNAINTRLSELTECAVTSVDQIERIKKAVAARGHEMASLGKHAVAAALAADPDEYVRELLTLRQRGAYASVRAAKRLLGFASADDGRIRGSLRIYGAGPGRWTSPGPQLQNLKRNDDEYPGHLISAVLAGDRAELARYGNALAVAAQLARAALCAREGHVLICADFASIESRVLAWFAGEKWKLDDFYEFDRLRGSGDLQAAEQIENYRVVAAKMLGIPLDQVGKVQRQQGKGGDLSCGYGGAIGAWRRIMGPKDNRPDDEIKANIQQWRNAHPATRRFWGMLTRAVHTAIRHNMAVTVQMYAEGPKIIAAFDGDALTLTLPSARAINYPGAHLVPNGKFEDGEPIEHFDNAKGQWKQVRAWFGLLVENIVQGTARDLLAAGLLRFDTRGWTTVFHCHDEIVIEAREGTVSEAEVLAALIESPPWAAGLPLGGKVHSGRLYFEEPGKPAKPSAGPVPAPPEELERAVDSFVASAEPLTATTETERDAEKEFLDSLTDDVAPLWDMVTLPMDGSHHVSCPFPGHDDPNPSCSIYADHFYCHGCHERGDRLDWLTKVEGMTRAEAIAAIMDWTGGAFTSGAFTSGAFTSGAFTSGAFSGLGTGVEVPSIERQEQDARKLEYALSLWDAAEPLAGTIGERYLAETRKIDVSKLPATISEALRFHKWCPFGGIHAPCVVALMRDPETDGPVGIHRIGLEQVNGKVAKIDRMARGHMGVVKLWPLNGGGRLVVGEGIETVLAAATRIPYQGAPLVPAWSTISAGGLRGLPVIGNVARLLILVDHDTGKDGAEGEGQKAARAAKDNWAAAGRQVTPLLPSEPGWDFNDVVLGRKA
jgi:DNA polymerase